MSEKTNSPRVCAVKTYNAIEGGNQTLGRLGEYLKTMHGTPRK